MKLARQDIALFALRLIIGALFVGTGCQKLLGWFGGGGIVGTGKVFATVYCQAGVCLVPGELFATVIGVLELTGGLCLLFGFLTPVFGAAFIVDMTMAMVFRSNQLGFFGTYGMSSNLLVLMIAFALLLLGSGRIGLDQAIRRSRTKTAEPAPFEPAPSTSAGS